MKRFGSLLLLFAVLLLPAAAQSTMKVPPKPAGLSLINKDKYVDWNGKTWGVQNADKPHSFVVMPDGELIFTIHSDDHWAHDVELGESKKNRSEVSGLEAGDNYSFSYEVMIEPGEFAGKGEVIFGQLHGHSDKGVPSGEHPAIAFRILPGGIPSASLAGTGEPPIKPFPKSRTIWTGTPADFKLGTWHTIKFDVQKGKDRHVDFYLDGKLLAHDTSAFGYKNTRPDYWKLGIYRPGGGDGILVAHYRKPELVAR